MYKDMDRLRCTIVRGGTSKGIFIKSNDLPTEPEMRDKVIRAIFGSPDIRQIDGLGGADTLTSKLAIIGPASRPDADIDYTFAQVGIDTAIVDYKGNCGNISSGVGPFAIDEGMVSITEPITTVRIHQTNTGKIIIANVPVEDGRAKVIGDFSIAGVPGSGALITLDFSDTQGAISGKLLPTGKVIDKVEVDGTEYNISIVDVGNPLVFIAAHELNLKGTELPDQIESNKDLMNRIEQIRGIAAEKLGLVKSRELSATESPYIPFFAIVSPPTSYNTYNKKTVDEKEIDLVSTLLFMLKVHKTYPGTGTVCTGAAAKIPGSVVWNLLSEEAKNKKTIVIGHPAGTIPVEAEAVINGNDLSISRVAIYRTARRIMDGYVYIKKA